MRRSEWAKVRPTAPGPVLLDIRKTPMSRVAENAGVIALTAQQASSGDFQLDLYRRDPKDPSPYNVDTFSLWENLPGRPDFNEIVSAASTDCDQNMLDFLEENVLIVPRAPGAYHWLDEEELPTLVRGLLSTAGSAVNQTGT